MEKRQDVFLSAEAHLCGELYVGAEAPTPQQLSSGALPPSGQAEAQFDRVATWELKAPTSGIEWSPADVLQTVRLRVLFKSVAESHRNEPHRGRWLTEGGSGRDARLGMEPEKQPLIKKANRS